MPSPRTALVGILVLSAAGVHPALGAPEVFVGLADNRGRDTFRSIRRGGDGSFSELTAQGLKAGSGPDGTSTYEVRAVFKPTIFAPVRAYQGLRVDTVSVQLGGAIGTIEAVTAAWGGATPASEVFSLSTSPVTSEGLVQTFQALVAAGGDPSVSPGFMIKSSEPLERGGSFLVRFAITMVEAAAWTITLREVQVAGTRRLIEFFSSRRGLASLTIGGQLAVDSIPVARDHSYRWELPQTLLQPGANEVRLRIVDPEDQSSQEATLSVQR